MKIKRLMLLIIRVFLIVVILYFSFATIFFIYIGLPKEIYETSRIKKVFQKNINIESVDRMDSQKDFTVCYDIYFTTTKNKNLMVSDVQIKNNEVVYIKFRRTDKEFNWMESIDTGDNNLYKDLFKLLNKINDY